MSNGCNWGQFCTDQWCLIQQSLIPIPGKIKSLDSDYDSTPAYEKDSRSPGAKSIIPIPIPLKSGIIPESILIPESESNITGPDGADQWGILLVWRQW